MSENEDLDAFERRLAAIDFSADSRVREELRARLLRRAASSGRRPSSPAIRALVFAACLIAVLIPALRRTLRDGSGSSSAGAAYPRGPEGLPVLPGRFASSAPTDGAATPFEVVRARTVSVEGGKAVVWDFEDGSFRLETRRIAPEELFEKSRMRGAL
jgi:hypothetical protein